MKTEKVYLLWAEYTSFFKVGYTTQSVGKRARDIESCCPFPLRVVGSFLGNKAVEQTLHQQLAPYRTRGEWFELPEEVVWQLLPPFLLGQSFDRFKQVFL